MASSALYSLKNPRAVLMQITAIITAASIVLSARKEMAAARLSTAIRGFLTCSMSRPSLLIFLPSSSSLGPRALKRLEASSELRPLKLLSSLSRACSALKACHLFSDSRAICAPPRYRLSSKIRSAPEQSPYRYASVAYLRIILWLLKKEAIMPIEFFIILIQ